MPLVKTRSWADIEHQYLRLLQHNWPVSNMIDLVKHIASSPLSERLFGYTSHDSLRITIYDPAEWNKETLVVDTDGKGYCDFIYHSSPFAKPTFVRRYSQDLIIPKFDNFIKMIGW